MKKVVVIGSGFAGMSAASFLAKNNYHVTVVEKHDMPGGRARKMRLQGFEFDMGPSWYWMPGVFENYFASFGKKVSDYYSLKRLDPSYRVYHKDRCIDVPADYESIRTMFDRIEPGSSTQLDAFLREAAYKYEVGINKLVYKPGRSLKEFLDKELLTGIFRLDVFNSMKSHVRKYFRHPLLIQLMEFPVLFLGASPDKIPALYSLMNYADIKLGTWYPEAGMYSIVDAMYSLAKELGVQFLFNAEVTSIKTHNGRATAVETNNKTQLPADIVVGAADYQFIESKLLDAPLQSYSEKYWNSRTMAPSCLLFYVGLNKKLNNIQHHSLFFDTDFEQHSAEIYDHPAWPSEPLFYVCAASVTDDKVAPAGCENLFFLIPVAAGLTADTETLRKEYFDKIITRYEQQIGEQVSDSIVCYKSYSVSDFTADYNAFKGNAYGLANTLQQTAILKPGMRSKKVKNLFYTGQLTVPGPGVPPALISGEVVAREVAKYFIN